MGHDRSSDHYPWCVEHDPGGTCLGGVVELPGHGGAWLEGAPVAKIVVALSQPSPRRLAALDASQARQVAAILERLADQVEHPTAVQHE